MRWIEVWLMRKEMLVSNAACRGCIHYGYFYEDTRCCNYCFDTGKCRPKGETPRECSVKELGNRAEYIKKLCDDDWFSLENWDSDGTPLGLA